MAEVIYDNIWTKLGLGTVRDNKIFKGLWRGARIAVVGALLALANNSALVMVGLEIPNEYVIMFAPVIEKWLREFVKATEF